MFRVECDIEFKSTAGDPRRVRGAFPGVSGMYFNGFSCGLLLEEEKKSMELCVPPVVRALVVLTKKVN